MARHRSIIAQLTDCIRKKPVSDADLKIAHLFLVDAVINMIAGRDSQEGRKLLFWSRTMHESANGLGTASPDPARSAFMNGAFCHILQMDDLHGPSSTHPGCTVVPALLALGQGLSARKVLTALLHGYEAVARIGMAAGPAHNRIWHNVGTVGPFGSAMAAAWLLDLDADQTVHALGNAGTQASGFMGFLEEGADAPHLHAGRAAEAGLVAATLAATGLSGQASILESPRGLFAATCPDGQPEAALNDPDAPWQIHAASLRRWPVPAHAQPTVQALRSVRREVVRNGLDPVKFVRIKVETHQSAMDLCDIQTVSNMCTALFSLQYAAVVSTIFDEVTPACFESPALETIAGLCQRVSASPALDISMRYPQERGARVTLHHGSRQTFKAESDGAEERQTASTIERDLTAKSKSMLALGRFGRGDPFVEVPGHRSFEEPFVFTPFRPTP